jgi:uncharacterized cupredoxin-like copper-binding protein
MKRLILLALFFTTVLALSACGSPAPTAAAVPSSPPPTAGAATDQPVPIEPAPATAAAPAQAAGKQVTITLADNTVQASLTEFKAGIPYHFVISNTGDHAHDFYITQPVSIAGSNAAAQSAALLAVPRSQLSEGATVIVDFTFPASAVGTQLEFSCLIRRHYDDGMFKAITVTP